MFLYEGDDIPAGLTAETVENLLLYRDSKGRRFLRMKRTQCLEISTGRPQRDATFGDNLNNVASAPNFVDRFAWYVVSCRRTVHGEFASSCQSFLQNIAVCSLFECDNGYAFTPLVKGGKLIFGYKWIFTQLLMNCVSQGTSAFPVENTHR